MVIHKLDSVALILRLMVHPFYGGLLEHFPVENIASSRIYHVIIWNSPVIHMDFWLERTLYQLVFALFGGLLCWKMALGWILEWCFCLRACAMRDAGYWVHLIVSCVLVADIEVEVTTQTNNLINFSCHDFFYEIWISLRSNFFFFLEVNFLALSLFILLYNNILLELAL